MDLTLGYDEELIRDLDLIFKVTAGLNAKFKSKSACVHHIS